MSTAARIQQVLRDGLKRRVHCWSGFRLKQEHLVLRQKQLKVLQTVYEGRDMVVWFPTGYGKSVCYQLLPYMLDVKFRRASAPPSI